MQKIIDEDYSHIMIEYVQEMSACDESKVATSTHLNPKGQRTQRRIKSDLVKIFAGCFATAKKLNGRGVERDIAYSSYSRPFCSSQLTESQEQAEISLKRESENLQTSATQKLKLKSDQLQNYLHIQYGCQPAIQVSFILYANVPVHDESTWNGQRVSIRNKLCLYSRETPLASTNLVNNSKSFTKRLSNWNKGRRCSPLFHFIAEKYYN